MMSVKLQAMCGVSVTRSDSLSHGWTPSEVSTSNTSSAAEETCSDLSASTKAASSITEFGKTRSQPPVSTGLRYKWARACRG